MLIQGETRPTTALSSGLDYDPPDPMRFCSFFI